MDIEKNSRNPVILVLGMAGSGKTSFVNMFSLYLKSIDKTSYSINLDPAVLNLPYKPNIDIRDIINYKEVMRKYKLGPNGAIVTSLNLFSTKINEVIKTIEENSCNYTYTIIDTPGQIEVFTWSASGMIISETLAGTWPTFIIYVVDTPRSINPCTFMSNMLNAVSCMYKTRLPLLVVFNKVLLS
uniref:GPN-loop GTPase n=1 Tax=Henneguya salminicola TaxID=69463 RepID=A0A6G3MHF1_HENSL